MTSVTGVGDETFEAEAGRGLLDLTMVGLGVFCGIKVVDVAGDGVTSGVVVVAVVAVMFFGGGLFWLAFDPLEVTLTEDGVALRARARVTTIPWPELSAVRLRTGRGRSLVWESQGRRPIRSSVFRHTGHLLAEIARRSPGTIVS